LSQMPPMFVLPVWLTPLSATLLHGGLLHLGFNLVMLYYCGREDEVALGRVGVITLYIIGAYAAAAAQYAVGPHSPVPMIGASGAISALVGAYAMLYGQRRPSKLPPELARWLHIAWLAAAWLAVQLLLGLVSHTQGMAIAWAAHVGGFFAGLVLARPLLRWRYRKA
jgi:membrane associated rhomboid family serine protease